MNDQILLMFGVFYTLFPLCLLLLPATVSSEFAALKEETTKLHLTSSVKNHLRVRSLETYLNHMNRGQGIGITVFGLKLDLNTLAVDPKLSFRGAESIKKNFPVS